MPLGRVLILCFNAARLKSESHFPVKCNRIVVKSRSKDIVVKSRSKVKF